MLIQNKKIHLQVEFFNTFITKIKITKIVITQFLYADILLHHTGTLVQKNRPKAEALNIASHFICFRLITRMIVARIHSHEK